MMLIVMAYFDTSCVSKSCDENYDVFPTCFVDKYRVVGYSCNSVQFLLANTWFATLFGDKIVSNFFFNSVLSGYKLSSQIFKVLF